MPISRERQIALAEKYQERVEKHLDKLLRVPVIREAIATPNAKQASKSRTYSVSTSLRTAKLG